jgi:hypothetical protein
MPTILRIRKKKEKESATRGRTLEDSVKADVALRLLGQRLKELSFLMYRPI